MLAGVVSHLCRLRVPRHGPVRSFMPADIATRTLRFCRIHTQDGRGIISSPSHAMCIRFSFNAEVFRCVCRAAVVRELSHCALGLD